MIRDEEQRLLRESGTNESGTNETQYEDPIPGAENWSTEEVNKGIVEFQALFDKVDHLKDMYMAKAQVCPFHLTSNEK